MTDIKDTLAALSEAATPGEWGLGAYYVGTGPDERCGGMVEVDDSPNGIIDEEPATAERLSPNLEFIVALVNAYRSGQLVPARAAAMSDLIAGDADLYDTPSARITGDKDRENPVEGAQPAPSDDLVAELVAVAESMAGLEDPDWAGAGRRAPTREECARARASVRAAIAAINQDTRSQVEREIVAWLRAENGLCDCYARSEGECACGAWDDYKTKPLNDIADAIEQGQYRSAPG